MPKYALTIVKGIQGKYELVIIHPSHFLIYDIPMVIKDPVTEEFKLFCAHPDGHLYEGGPPGLPLPPLHSRGTIERGIPLNPILVNFAAII